MKLYEYHEAFHNIIALFDDESIDSSVIQNALVGLHMDFETKCENIAKWNKALSLEAESIKLEEQRLAKRRKALENRVENNKSYMEGMMKLTGKTKFNTPLFSFNISKNAPTLKISEEAEIPQEFIKVTTAIDKRELLTAIKNGLSIEGVEITQSESLKIR